MEPFVYRQFYELERTHWWFQGMYAICRDILRKHVVADNSRIRRAILDVGCGTGLWTTYLVDYGRVFALDNSSISIDLCRAQGVGRVIRARAGNLPIADSTCDVITALGLIEHLEDDEGFINEVRRVLKPGGYALLLTSAYMFLWGSHDDVAHHKRRYTHYSLAKKIRKYGLEIVKISYVNTFLFLPILFMRLIERVGSRRKCAHAVSPDLFLLPYPLNQLLYVLLILELYLLRRVSLPLGVGLIALVRK